MKKSILTGLLVFFATMLPVWAEQAVVVLDLEQEICSKINAHRRSLGLSLLDGNHSLEEAARSHSLEMANLNYFSHQSPNPATAKVRQRVEAHAISPQSLAENISVCDGYETRQVAAYCVEGWLESAGHKKNIESTKYQFMSVGVARIGKKFYVTQVFAGGALDFEKAYTDPNAPKVPTRLDDISAAVCELVNVERRREGLPDLTLESILKKAADGHSEEMLRLGYFSHWSPDPGRTDVRNRVNLAGGDPVRLAENIYTCSGYPPEKVAKLAVESWMKSPGHRANILDGRLVRVGVGVYRRGDTYYVTQDFSGDK